MLFLLPLWQGGSAFNCSLDTYEVENLNKEVFKSKLTEVNAATFREHNSQDLRPWMWDTHVEIMACSCNVFSSPGLVLLQEYDGYLQMECSETTLPS